MPANRGRRGRRTPPHRRSVGTSPTGDRGFNEQMRRAFQEGKHLTLFTDEFRSPIPAVVTARRTCSSGPLEQHRRSDHQRYTQRSLGPARTTQSRSCRGSRSGDIRPGRSSSLQMASIRRRRQQHHRTCRSAPSGRRFGNRQRRQRFLSTCAPSVPRRARRWRRALRCRPATSQGGCAPWPDI